MQKLIIPQPPTLNELINISRSNKYAAAASKKRWTTIAAKAALKQMKPLSKVNDIRVIATLDYKTRASDGDNLNTCIKYILDGVAKADIISNDNLTRVVSPQIFLYRKIGNSERKQAEVLFFDQLTEWIDYVKNIDNLLAH